MTIEAMDRLAKEIQIIQLHVTLALPDKRIGAIKRDLRSIRNELDGLYQFVYHQRELVYAEHDRLGECPQ